MKQNHENLFLISTLAILLILEIPFSYSQNVGINNFGGSPNTSALLDIDVTGMTPQKGLLIPRVALTSATDAVTITTPATSLLVYNTNGGLSPAGYYYNQGTSGSPNWVAFLTNNVNASSAWSLTGNTGTTASTSAIGVAVNNNFIGTTDAKDFVFASNNLERMRITSGGNVGIGTTTPSSAAKLQINTTVDRTTTNIGNAFFVDNASFATGVGGILYLGGKFDAAGTSLREYGYVAGVKSNATDGNFDGDLVFGTRTNGASPNTERLRILANGNVGIGTTTPSSAAKLQINTTVDRTTTNIGNAFFVDNASFATGVGGILYLGGKFDAAGTSLREYGYVAGVKSNATDGNFDGDLVFGTRTNGASPNTERLRILANGNVGIGTISPATKLEINGGSGTTLKIVDGNQGAGKVLTSDAGGVATWATLTSSSPSGTWCGLLTAQSDGNPPSGGTSVCPCQGSNITVCCYGVVSGCPAGYTARLINSGGWADTYNGGAVYTYWMATCTKN